MKPFSPPRLVLCFRNCHLTHLRTLVIMTEIDAAFAQPKTAHKYDNTSFLALTRSNSSFGHRI